MTVYDTALARPLQRLGLWVRFASFCVTETDLEGWFEHADALSILRTARIVETNTPMNSSFPSITAAPSQKGFMKGGAYC